MSDQNCVDLAIAKHERDCTARWRTENIKLWQAHNSLLRDAGILSNAQGTGQVDVLWQEREEKMQTEKETRKYWFRLVVGYLVIQALSLCVFLLVMISRINALAK